jgi:Protein of unknown function (DUF1570)
MLDHSTQRRNGWSEFVIAIGVWMLSVPVIWSQTPTEWLLEKLHTRDGLTVAGLLLSERNERYEFAEIVRPLGKPAYAIIRSVPTMKVVLYQPLEAADQAQLAERYVSIRHRAQIEARRMDELKLTSVEQSNAHFAVYDGPWFTFYSTADDLTTRRAIVRLEQTFCAYRQLLPPTVQPASQFQIYFYGTSREYREAQLARGWNVPHPALYAPQANIVLTGSDWTPFQQELDRATAHNKRTREQWKIAASSYEETLTQVAQEMKQQGFSADAIESNIRLQRAQWNAEQKEAEKAISESDQNNQAKFKEATESIFRRLQHEAFHAYLENYAYPSGRFQVPRWLNEGLAQVFEFAQLDADTLRVDTPPPTLVSRWKQDWKSGRPLPLRELLTDERPLTSSHNAPETAARQYLYAWALTYYLAFQQERLVRKEFTQYVVQEPHDPVVKFERLVGKSLEVFEKQWHADMLKLK